MSVSHLPLLCQWWWGESFRPKNQLNMSFQNLGENVHLAMPNSAAKTYGRTNTRTKFSRWKFWLRLWKRCQHWPQVTTPASSTLASSPGREPPSMTSSWKVLSARLSTLLLGSRSISSFLCNFLSHVSSSCVCLRSHQWTILHFISSFLESEQCNL